MIRIYPVVTVPGLYTPLYFYAEAALSYMGRANETLPKIRFNPSKLRDSRRRLLNGTDCGCNWGAYCSARNANEPQVQIDRDCVHNYKWVRRNRDRIVGQQTFHAVLSETQISLLKQLLYSDGEAFASETQVIQTLRALNNSK